MKLALFLGSGVSFPTGLPCANKITEDLLNGEWFKRTDNCFYPGKHENPFSKHSKKYDWSSRLQEFLKRLKSFADGYFVAKGWPEATYEDIFYLANQLYDEEMGEIDNPAISPFVQYIKQIIPDLCESMPIDGEVKLKDLADRSMKFIQCVLINRLYTENKIKGLKLLIDLAKNINLDQLDILTLNHDLLIEKLFNQSKIIYSDGFGLKDGQIRIFQSEYSGKIRLLKLHGSINWARMRARGADDQVDYWCSLENGCIGFDESYNSQGVGFRSLEGRAIMLVGTYNKYMDYFHGLSSKIQEKFNQFLEQHNIIVMSGYGWNDRGINGRLMEWIYSSNRNRLFLLYENPEILKSNSKSALWHAYDELVKNKRIIPIPKYLQDVALDELMCQIENQR